jgi:hypothetical protein
MKKIVFAVQVFGLIAMFPIVVILEMNHTAGGSSESNSPSSRIQTTEKTSIRLPENAKEEMENDEFSITLEPFLLKKSF